MNKRFYGLVGKGSLGRVCNAIPPPPPQKKRLLSVANSSLQYILLLIH